MLLSYVSPCQWPFPLFQLCYTMCIADKIILLATIDNCLFHITKSFFIHVSDGSSSYCISTHPSWWTTLCNCFMKSSPALAAFFRHSAFAVHIQQLYFFVIILMLLFNSLQWIEVPHHLVFQTSSQVLPHQLSIIVAHCISNSKESTVWALCTKVY